MSQGFCHLGGVVVELGGELLRHVLGVAGAAKIEYHGCGKLSVVNGDLRGAKTIFLETCVLHCATRIFAAQLVENGASQHAFALAVDKHDFLPHVFLIGFHHLAELVELIVQHVGA